MLDLVTPAIGIIFWTTIIFSLLLILLRVFAWKPILNAVKERNDGIAEALNSAEKAKSEMAKLKADNEEILRGARIERDQIIKEARELKDQLITDAKTQAKTEADKIIQAAKHAIESEKRAAINDMKNQIAKLSVEVAEKLLKKELADKNGQNDLINQLLDNSKIN